MQIFMDSNILVYAHDEDAGSKHQKAKSLIKDLWVSRKIPAVSVQVLQETHENLVRKGIALDKSVRRVGRYLAWRIVDNSKELFIRSLDIQKMHQLSYWDALIVAAAQRAQATELWTEDLNTGQHFDGVTAVNPLL